MVNDSYSKRHGVSYLGSRDIDVCFHVDPQQGVEDLRNSIFAKALEVVRKEGYVPYGSYRFCKILSRSGNKTLTEMEAKVLPLHELTYLYVDMMVDHIHPEHRSVFKCDPLDEPIAAQAFNEGEIERMQLNGFEVYIPSPAYLLATKLRSIPHRQRDDKLWKDACDIYSIIWHSPVSFSGIIDKVRKRFPNECSNALPVITEEVTERASYHLGIEPGEFMGIINRLRL